MNDTRIANTAQAASRLGFIRKDGLPDTQAFIGFTHDNNIKPVRGKKHHYWWDLNALNACLDKNAGIKPKSGWREIFKERIKLNGSGQSEIPSH